MRYLAPTLGIVMVANALHAAPNETPLFTEFKMFCIDTRAKPEAVKLAIEAAGGQQHAAGTTTTPFPMTMTSWDRVADGHHMQVSTGAQHVAASAGHPSMEAEACAVMSSANEDTSIPLIRKWAGAPDNGQDEVSFYQFQELDSARLPIDSGSDLARAQSEGRAWQLTIVQKPDHASVQLLHIRASPY